MNRRVEVGVVGAGVAGLTAARRLAAAGVGVVVLEARDRVGGRTYDVPIGDGEVVEMGGQWIGPTQDRVAALARELGVDTFPTHHEGEHLVQLRHDEPMRRYDAAFPPLSGGSQQALDEALEDLEAVAATVDLDAPWATPDAAALDGSTVQAWVERRVEDDTARSFLLFSLEAMGTSPATELSMLDILFHVASAGGLGRMLDVSEGAQQDRFVGGSQRIARTMAEQLGAEAVLLAAPVRAVERTSRGVRIRSDAGDVDAERAIVAVPPTLAGRIAYDPPLPPRRDGLTQRMPQGSVIKVNVVYETPFWREDGLSGEALTPEAVVSYTLDNSPPSGRPGVLVGFVDAARAQALGQAPSDERRRTVLDSLSASFGPRAASPRDYLELDWSAEEWTRGCYAAHMVTGTWTAYGPALRAPCDLIHWAGTETADRWAGYLDGAVRSGERAADEVLEALGGQRG